MELAKKVSGLEKRAAALEEQVPERPSQVYTIDLGPLKKYSKILFTTDKTTYDEWDNIQQYDILINDKMIDGINVYLAGILPDEQEDTLAETEVVKIIEITTNKRKFTFDNF